jgi:MFS family permease
MLPCLTLTSCALASLSLLTPRLWHVYATFAALGAAAGGSSALAYSRVVSSWFQRRRGMALALMIAGGGAGGIVHPPVAQALIDGVGWRSACQLLGAAVAVIGLPTVAGFVRERVGGWQASGGPAGASVGEAMRSPVFWILAAVVFGSTLAGHGALVHVPALLVDRGLSERQAALGLSALGGASLLGRLLTGWLLDRFAAARVAFALLAVAALGTFLLAHASSFATAALAAALIGFGIGGELDVTPYLLARFFGLRSLSTLYGLTWTALGSAGAVGPVLLARAFDATGSYAVVLSWFAVGLLAVAGLLLALPAQPALQTPRDPAR